jgi:hypothetical protein
MLKGSVFFQGGWLAFLLSAPAIADELSSIRILALSPADSRVVLKNEADQVLVLAPGDLLLGNDYRVRQILADRLVLEAAPVSVANEMVWLFKPRSEGAESRIQRFSGKPDDERKVLDVIESSSELELSGSADKAE